MDCSLCPAQLRCGGIRNFCGGGHTGPDGTCSRCENDPLLRIEVRQAIIKQLGGLDLDWPRTVKHPQVPELPAHLPVMVQAYADRVDVPWVALHGARLFGLSGERLTPKHHRPLRDVYCLGPRTRIAIEFYVDDRVLEGLWRNRSLVVAQLRQLDVDLVLTPNFSVWQSDVRFAQLLAIRRAAIFYFSLIEAEVTAIPDISYYFFEPDGRLWAEWVNRNPEVQAVSLFCGGKKIHASERALRETLEDIALFHQAVRPDVTFILGGVHSPERVMAYRHAALGRRLVFCNGMAYALAQRRKVLDKSARAPVPLSSRDCFLRNSRFNDRVAQKELA